MKKTTYLVLLFLVGFFVWFPIFKIFYLQDEWQGLGHIIAEGITHPIAGANFIELIFGENRSLARLLGYFLFGQFQLNSLPLAIFSLVFHFINTYFVFVLSQKLIKKIFVSIIAAGAFMLSSVSANAVYWYSASVGTLPATTLILLSLILYFKYVKDRDTKKLYLIFLTIFLSLFFKEIGIFLFLFLPIYDLLFIEKRFSYFIKRYWPFLLFFGMLTLFRISVLRSISDQKALFLTGGSQNFIQTLLVRGVLYPSTSLSLEYFPAPFLVKLAGSVVSNYYSFIPIEQRDLIAQTSVLDSIALVFSILIIFSIITTVRKEEPEIRKIIYFWLLFIVLSFLPYIIISKSYSYLESRYYYLSMVGAGIIIAWFLEKLLVSKIFVSKLIASLMIVLYLTSHVNFLRKELNNQAVVSGERVKFVKQITSMVDTTTNQKNIFYINSESDYYIPGNKIPFQQGTGYTLMVMLKNRLPISNKFLLDHYLWEIGSQGYKEIDGYGFGYFSDLTLLKEVVTKYKIPKDSIHSFTYDSKKQVLYKLPILVK